MRTLKEFWRAIKRTLSNENGFVMEAAGILSLLLQGLGMVQQANQPTGAEQKGGMGWNKPLDLYPQPGVGSAMGETARSPFASGSEAAGYEAYSSAGIPSAGMYGGTAGRMSSEAQRMSMDAGTGGGTSNTAANVGGLLKTAMSVYSAANAANQPTRTMQGNAGAWGDMPALYGMNLPPQQDMTLEELMELLMSQQQNQGSYYR